MKWAKLCWYVALNPLLVFYRDPLPILNTFARQYRAESLAPRRRQVQSHTFEDAAGLIGQVLVSMEAPDPRLTSQCELDIRIWFQDWCCIKQDPPPNRVKPIPLQVPSHISSISTALGDPILMVECNIIIIAYFFLLRAGEYTESKSEIISLRLEDNTFSWSRSVFLSTATASDIQAANFVTIPFTTQKNGVRGENIGHKTSSDPLLWNKAALLLRVVHLISNMTPPSTPLAHFMTPEGRWEISPPPWSRRPSRLPLASAYQT